MGGREGGLRPKDERAKGKKLELSTHTWCCLYFTLHQSISHNKLKKLQLRHEEEKKVKMKRQGVVR